MKVNSQSVPVLMAIVSGALSATAIAKHTKTNVPAVRGALRNLRNNGLISGDNETVELLPAGRDYAKSGEAKSSVPVTPTGRQHKRTTKIAKAHTLFDRFEHRGRGVVLQKFQSELEMSEGQASTYYQNIRRERGMSTATA